MKEISERAEAVSSEQSQRKVCEACGEGFVCKSMAAGCWCEEIRLTAAAREEISRRYCDCLCRDCLTIVSANKLVVSEIDSQ